MKTLRGNVTVTILVLMVMLIITVTAAVSVGIASIRDNLRYNSGENALVIAQSGVENSILRLLRDPSYTVSNANLPVGTGYATITVSGSNPKTITSIGTIGDFRRTLVANVTISGGQLIINSWIEP